jgi:tetratricopeptide (TPR) repeat protein
MKRYLWFSGAAVSAGLIFCSFFASSCLSGNAASADEYFSIGMAYYEMGRYSEAERWLNRAKAVDKTMEASEYNLGRIAFETGRYREAAEYFENILQRDPVNVMALRGAAYSRVKNADIEQAGVLYARVLALVPESADDGYNHALVLYAMEKYGESEAVLLRFGYALDENNDALLLLARAQKAQGKIEAIDTYDKWAAGSGGSAQGLYEYAGVLENADFFARAVEQYRASLAALKEDTETLKKTDLRFDIARVLFIADPENGEGVTELNAAVEAGFADVPALEALAGDERITEANREGILKAIDTINRVPIPETGPEPSETDGEGSADAPQE